jgi:hypothetical protein
MGFHGRVIGAAGQGGVVPTGQRLATAPNLLPERSIQMKRIVLAVAALLLALPVAAPAQSAATDEAQRPGTPPSSKKTAAKKTAKEKAVAKKTAAKKTAKAKAVAKKTAAKKPTTAKAAGKKLPATKGFAPRSFAAVAPDGSFVNPDGTLNLTGDQSALNGLFGFNPDGTPKVTAVPLDKLVGLWQIQGNPPNFAPGSVVEFTSDGQMNVGDGVNASKLFATYTIVTGGLKLSGQPATALDSFTVTKLTDTELVTREGPIQSSAGDNFIENTFLKISGGGG